MAFLRRIDISKKGSMMGDYKSASDTSAKIGEIIDRLNKGEAPSMGKVTYEIQNAIIGAVLVGTVRDEWIYAIFDNEEEAVKRLAELNTCLTAIETALDGQLEITPELDAVISLLIDDYNIPYGAIGLPHYTFQKVRVKVSSKQ
jgi:hypothetical protein